MAEKKMRAAVVTGPGELDVLQVVDLPLGPVLPGYARVRLTNSSINAADLWTRRPGVVESYPHIPGSDGCGVLEEVNGGAIALDIGQRVIINPALQLQQGKRSWHDEFADIVDILGYSRSGTCAEYCDVPIENVFATPDHLTNEEAAALPLTFLTAWRMLVRRGAVKPGEAVLVWGASGGLGSAAVHISRHLGAHVLAAAGNDQDESAIATMGAHSVIRYDRGSVHEQVQDAIGRQVDLVFDSVAGPTWAESLLSLRPGGRIVLAGTTAGDIVTHDLSDFFYYQWSLLGCRMGDEKDFAAMLRAVGDGNLRPTISKVYPMAQIALAHKEFEEGKLVGKIVLDNVG